MRHVCSGTMLHEMLLTLYKLWFVLFAGFTKASPPNLTTDFGVYGVRGVMNGAAIIFFAYLGYDAVATLAEEVCLGHVYTAPKGILHSVW